MPDNPDAVITHNHDTDEWLYLCSHCGRCPSYPGRDRAFVWDRATEHCMFHHGIRRTFVQTSDDRHAQMVQTALPLLFDLGQRARAKPTGGNYG